MDFPEEMHYTEEHEWVLVEDDVASIGITDFAQDSLGDIVFVELPDVGATVEAGKPFGVVESVKAVSDIYSPVTGEVVEVNEELPDTPETVNTSPYEDAWMIKVKLADASELDELMSADDYKEFIQDN
ncbi:MAG TPA: glycine cleavage system protein GcvH [Geothermobacteraceae bacterium]|nr:glycine cleavage system protein GcvH [Geothermobacteraceae bacterium]